ncbi:MAG: oxaloacetate decarboxylase [Alphaproteobacteria bacterium]
MTRFRDRLKQSDIVIAPGVYDGLSALMVQQAGFEAAYLSGASIAYTRFGLPDIGLVSLSEAADALAAIRERTTIPVIADIDTGFGNALNVQRTVRLFERLGAAAVQIEDQVTPKRCGHLAEKALIPIGEMTGKIKAALDARHGGMVLIARTDAIAVEGFERALERADAYADAGADLLFIEAPPTVDHMQQVAARYANRVPVMANMVEGGKTPILPAGELERMGFRLAIFPGGTVRALAYALQSYFAQLKRDGTTDAMRDRMLDFQGLNKLLETEDFLARGKRYDPDKKL